MKKNQDATSEVVGVVLMVAITVAIAATVYVYVSGMMEASCNEQSFVLCGKIEHMSSGNSWTRYDVLVMEDEYNSIHSVGDNAFAVMKYAYQNNCNVTVTITYSSNCNKYITEATLLEC